MNTNFGAWAAEEIRHEQQHFLEHLTLDQRIEPASMNESKGPDPFDSFRTGFYGTLGPWRKTKLSK